ncbi:MAG: alginate export family protein [Candidatus Omnitrophica bacterium]|nr:alginate export family protein [Candidatus Omnitrophota bacterium]
MSKRLIVVLALLFVVGIACAAYAEVQNVKVSGDILVSGVAREHFNLQSSRPGAKSFLKQSFLMSQIRVRIDADLTDNVMATVRLINERVWNGQNDSSSSGNSNVDLDLAYVTLKEFLYSPLSLTVGRQEIRFGNGLIMGNAKVANTSTRIPTDLTERKAFDAIRATLNYDPLVVDFIYAKVRQADNSDNTDTVNNDDTNTINLAGINAAYALNKNTNVSAYYYIKKDRYKNDAADADTRQKADMVNTIGALITSAPIENLTASLEAAYQFGRNDSTITNQKEHNAWSLQAMADYTFAKVKTTPMIGASYTYLSGSKNNTSETRNSGWDPMFYDQKLNNIVYTLLPFTNMSVFNLKASCKPVEDVTIGAVYGYYDVAKKSHGSITCPNNYDGTGSYYTGATYTGKSHLGDALDITATYDYTEDVQFGLTGGYFRPGRGISIDGKDAQQLIGSMKVTF